MASAQYPCILSIHTLHNKRTTVDNASMEAMKQCLPSTQPALDQKLVREDMALIQMEVACRRKDRRWDVSEWAG